MRHNHTPPSVRRRSGPLPPPQPPERCSLWPDPHGDLSEGEANLLVEYLNSLYSYSGARARWEVQEHHRTQSEIEFVHTLYSSALDRYFQQHADPETQSVELVTGWLSVEKWPAELQVESEAAALAWCERHANAAIDVHIQLNGSFERLLRVFMQQHLSSYLHDPNVFWRKVSETRLHTEWTETGLGVPDGCVLLPTEIRLVISSATRQPHAPPTLARDPRKPAPEEGDPDDA